MLVTDEFSEPRSAMLASDGSATALKGIDLLAGTPVFKGMPLHLVMVGPYGHSRIRQFLVGSTTASTLETAEKPLVILR